MSKVGVPPAGGRLRAADIPAPAGPGGGGPAASAQPPCPRCKQSLTEQQGAQGKAQCRGVNALSAFAKERKPVLGSDWNKCKLMAAFCLRNKKSCWMICC